MSFNDDLSSLLERIRRGDRIARGTIRIILILDVYQGACWTFGDPNRTLVPVFRPARQFIDHHVGGIDPARVWGSVLLLVGLLALAALEWRHELVTRMLIVSVCFFWTFWLVLNLYSAFQPRASLTAWASTGIVLVGHARAVIGSQLLTRRAITHGG